MPVAAAVPAAAGILGAGAAVGLGAAGVGNSKYSANNYGDTKFYDPNAFQYGGRVGGANDASNAAYANQIAQNNRMGGADAMAGGMLGASQDTYNVGQVGTAYAQSALDAQAGARAQQQQALGLLAGAANGQNLVSNAVAAQQAQQLAAQQQSLAASARGPAALALAQQNAAGNMSTGQAQIAQNAMIAGGQERLAAQNAFLGGAGGVRQQDLGAAQAGTGLAGMGYGASQGYGSNAIGAMNAGTGAGNLGLGYGQLANQINTTQLGAQQNQQQLLAGSHAQEQAINSGTQAANAGNEAAWNEGAIGSVSGGAAGTSKALAAQPPPPPAAGSGGSGGGGGGGGGATSDARAKRDVYMMGQADGLMAGYRHALANGPAVGSAHGASGGLLAAPGRDPMTASLASGLAPYSYQYKPGFGPPGPNVGPMAQNMTANPVTAVAVQREPGGLLSLDRDRMMKLTAGGVGHLAARQQMTEQQAADANAKADALIASYRGGLLAGPSVGGNGAYSNASMRDANSMRGGLAGGLAR